MHGNAHRLRLCAKAVGVWAQVVCPLDGHTAAGSILGTADYMAPEQATGGVITPRTDLYAIGSVMYAMLVGRPPFRGKSVTAVITQLRDEAPVPLDAINLDLPDALVHLVHDLLAKDPDDRPPTALAMTKRLRAMRAGLMTGTTQAVDASPTQHDGAAVGDQTDPASNLTKLSSGGPEPGHASTHQNAATIVSRGRGATAESPDRSLSDPSGGRVSSADTSDPSSRRNVNASAAPRQTVGSRVTAGPLAVGGTAIHSDQASVGSPAEAMTHFKTVEQERLDELTSAGRTQRHQTLVAAAGLALVVSIMAAAFYVATRPPTASDLYARAVSGDRAAAEAFLRHHADDSRSESIQFQLDDERLHGVEKRLKTRQRLGLTPMSPAEIGFLKALADRKTDPQTTVERLDGWLAVFGEEDSKEGGLTDAKARDANPETELAPLVRHLRRRIATVTSPPLDPRAIELMSKIRAAAANPDADAARRTLRGILSNFSDQRWADPAVEEAELQLEILRELSQAAAEG